MQGPSPLGVRGVRDNSEWKYLWDPTHCTLESLTALPWIGLLILLTRKYKVKHLSLSNPGRTELLP